MINNNSGSVDEVDAIEDGKIVRVSSEYARREGLLVLRKNVDSEKEQLDRNNNARIENKSSMKVKRASLLDFDKYRKPLDYNKNQVVSSLIDNFHWEIGKARKALALNRRQLAKEVGCTEEEVRMLENGILPKDDFVLISRVEKVLKINLRKNGIDYNKPLLGQITGKSIENKKVDVFKEQASSLVGDEIDIIELK